jgi:hypothetical protein
MAELIENERKLLFTDSIKYISAIVFLKENESYKTTL